MQRTEATRHEAGIAGVLIAAKMDLADRSGAITSSHGKEFGKELGLEYFETCATKGDVHEPFHFLAEVFHLKYTERKTELENLH